MALLLAIPDGMRNAPGSCWPLAIAELARVIEVRTLDSAPPPDGIEYALAWKPPSGVLAHYPKLKAIFSMGAGVDHLMGDPSLPDAPIVRYVDPDLTNRMSEYVVQHVLMHHRRWLDYAEQQRAGVWRDLYQPRADEVRVGVMGFGVLGQDAAAKLRVLGFQVAGWGRMAKSVDGVSEAKPSMKIDSYAGETELDAFLARTDILVCLLPLTPDTRGMLNAALFARLARDGAVPAPSLINAARGGLQNEADIIAALNAGILAAASLDVFDEEPLPPSSPLWHHPRVILTPHNAAWSEPLAVARSVAKAIAAHQRGEPLANLVDRARGY
ncbi:MAG: glyoxylate/hydroxypyruvate reductase A [Hyphomicrobiales bacterium]|nr:glyoxylate/hydroxypyruvate reductase A [Hyphomicrobiales bacterium]